MKANLTKRPGLKLSPDLRVRKVYRARLVDLVNDRESGTVSAIHFAKELEFLELPYVEPTAGHDLGRMGSRGVSASDRVSRSGRHVRHSASLRLQM